eukprot:CAMPEP_0204042992 /NCGR_PEP_ID=MMETSP0360-20130528/100126_1 /ASSEMBLY_ACC=CAM_ASM_000342 /TAXON_ID=268821 /ORGANISM="Scrippsiella Hangoei, Strain SHTV-5" /LENGTH=34 /DNA_ID= /DNA_START= /DNA_END= /DNA_ORIENTATION=
MSGPGMLLTSSSGSGCLWPASAAAVAAGTGADVP